MRLVEDATLNEAIVYSEPTEDGHRLVIIRDPTAQQFSAMLTKSRNGLLRLLCHNRQVYCWDGYYLDHDMGAHLLGFVGGPAANIGERLEATHEFVNCGKEISVDIRGTKIDPRHYPTIRRMAQSNAKDVLSGLLREYPRLNNLVGNLPVNVDCKVIFDGDYEVYRDMQIGALNSYT
jgi:hypothetical protein